MAGKRRESAPPSPAPDSPPAPSATVAADEAGAPAAGSPFPIVGVGASAGGLEAFTQMLSALPVDTGMAFVLVQHLAPTRASLLAEILSRTTAMPVMEVQEELRVAPNHVYVIPPDRNMVISQDTLQLLPRQEGRGQNRPIDVFFRSLAEHQKHQAIGVILSGTATDGTLGLEEIKAEGGITFAQDDTAQQDSMPCSAVASGCVDFVLPPDEIAREIDRIARHPYVAPVPPAKGTAPAGDPDLRKILETVRRGTGVDFSQYKASTLHRRIARRMVVHRIDGLQDYARFLRKNPDEVATLYRDMLINVTSFFRGPETFEALKTKILPKLFKDRSRHEPLRIWVPGCSTGEEAYSLAIICAELAEARGKPAAVQIFATDLNGAAIDKARAGVYEKSIEHDVSPERLRRFFVEVDGSYRVAKMIRDMCVFARHNVLADPPFSQIDLLSCRNFLIYLEPALQQKVVPLLHYALKPAGWLVLGSSETIGSFRDLFEAEDSKNKIYAKTPGTHRVVFGQPAGRSKGGELGAGPARLPPAGTDVQKEADRILLARYVPPSVLVDGGLEILQLRGDTGPYLSPSPGKASLNLLRMAREGLLVPLRSAVNKARKQGAAAREEGLRLKTDGGSREINLEVVPVNGSAAGEGGFLILFEEPGAARKAKGKARQPGARAAEAQETAAGENAHLQQELAATREYLQSVVEQQEAANEELQSANEEVQSANEELQSINEELETSKEEIQSANEELATVNDELQNRNVELNQLNGDLVNLVSSVDMGIVILGRDLRVRRFTPMAEKPFNLSPGDVGRPIGDVKLNLDVAPPETLATLLAEVIDTVSAREREVQDREGRWYSLRIRPYRTLDHKIEGAVILLVDVDTLRRAREFAESIVATVRESLVVLDADLRIQKASRSFFETFHLTREKTEGRLLSALRGGPWKDPELRRLLDQVLHQEDGFDDFALRYEAEQGNPRTLMLNGRRLVQESGQSPFILLAIEDVTLRQHVQELAAADRRKERVPGSAGPRAAQPTGPAPQRRAGAGGSRRRCRDRRTGPRNDGPPGAPHGPADRRPAGRLPDHPGQDPAAQATRGPGGGRQGGCGAGPVGHRGARPGAGSVPAA